MLSCPAVLRTTFQEYHKVALVACKLKQMGKGGLLHRGDLTIRWPDAMGSPDGMRGIAITALAYDFSSVRDVLFLLLNGGQSRHASP